MQQIQTNLQSFTFTAEEEISALSFSPLQRAFLQNELTVKVQTRLALNFDAANPYTLMQEDAYLKGQMEFIESLLAAAPEDLPEA